MRSLNSEPTGGHPILKRAWKLGDLVAPGDVDAFIEQPRTHPAPTFSSIDAAPKTSKGWGDEVEIVNLDYCGKLLRFRKGAKLSMHSHAQKAESFLISSGRISFGYIDTSNAQWSARLMSEGDIVHIPRMLPHQIEALEDTVVTEFSTHHENADSYRVFPGNSQQP